MSEPTLGRNGRAVDPTPNVQALSEAINKSQTDMREELAKRLTAEIHALKETINALMMERDKRYAQRHIASEKALDDALKAQKELMKERLACQERAVLKSEMSAEKRFDGLEASFKLQSQQERAFMPRMEAEKLFNIIGEKLGVQEGFRTQSLSEGAGSRQGWSTAVGVVGVVLAVLSIVSVGIIVLNRLP